MTRPLVSCGELADWRVDFRTAMDESGVGQETIGAVLGVGQSYVSRVCSGERCFSADQLCQLEHDSATSGMMLRYYELRHARRDPRAIERRRVFEELHETVGNAVDDAVSRAVTRIRRGA